MIGYHHTTWEAWQEIQVNGLKLTPLSPRHYDDFACVLDLVKDGCIWLYKRFQPMDQLTGLLIYVVARHPSRRPVCLEVEYDDLDAASRLGALAAFARGEDWDYRLTHNLDGVGLFGHFAEPVELLVHDVPPERIRLLGEWNFSKFAQQGLIQSPAQVEVA